MPDMSRDILQCIGNTRMLPLRRIVPSNSARILLKVESENPTGSMKDRMALAMIEAAEADGRLQAGGSVVEYTGGSTGVSLSLVCAVKGYPLDIVTSDSTVVTIACDTGMKYQDLRCGYLIIVTEPPVTIQRVPAPPSPLPPPPRE